MDNTNIKKDFIDELNRKFEPIKFKYYSGTEKLRQESIKSIKEQLEKGLDIVIFSYKETVLGFAAFYNMAMEMIDSTGIQANRELIRYFINKENE